MNFFKEHWDKIITILFSSGALLISLLVYCHDIERSKKETLIDIQLSGEMMFDSVYVSTFSKAPKTIGDYGNYYTGINLFYKIKIYNNSQHPVAIDKVQFNNLTLRNYNYEVFFKECYENDLTIPYKFPRYIESFNVENIYVKVSIPISESLRNKFIGLKGNSFYSHNEVIYEYNKNSRTKWGISKNDNTSLLFILFDDIKNKYNEEEILSIIAVYLSDGNTISKRISLFGKTL